MLESFHPLGGREFKMVVTLKAKIRDAFGKEKVKKLRAEGGLPAVAYGPGLEEPLHLVLDLREAQKTITREGRDADYELIVGRKKYHALLQEVQRDPLSGEFLHVDLYLPASGK